jgi:hypothetical protein
LGVPVPKFKTLNKLYTYCTARLLAIAMEVANGIQFLKKYDNQKSALYSLTVRNTP